MKKVTFQFMYMEWRGQLKNDCHSERVCRVVVALLWLMSGEWSGLMVA